MIDIHYYMEKVVIGYIEQVTAENDNLEQVIVESNNHYCIEQVSVESEAVGTVDEVVEVDRVGVGSSRSERGGVFVVVLVVFALCFSNSH